MIDIREEMKNRWKIARSLPCRAILFDIDHNLGDEKGHVSSLIIDELSKLITERRVIIGFVTGRPEIQVEGQPREGKEIMIVVDEITKKVPSHLYKYILIYPEHAGYGKNIGTQEVYDFGFNKLMKSFPLESLHNYIAQAQWFDRIQKKHTGISLWAKNEFQNKQSIEGGVEFIKKWAILQKIENKIRILNGANRTVDILFKEVNKYRAITSLCDIFNMNENEIAASDDQADIGQTGFDLTNISLGFATNEFNPDFINTRQISTQLAFNKTKIEANIHLIKNLNFVPVF
jgi:hydroxymethylpyrimidine pyrophosphatase-like HAD family hydrolase